MPVTDPTTVKIVIPGGKDFFQDLEAETGLRCRFVLESFDADYSNRIENRNYFFPDKEGKEAEPQNEVTKDKKYHFEDSFQANCLFTRDIERGASFSVELLLGRWSEDAYLLLPGAVYNGNRFLKRKLPYSPKLVDEKDLGPDSPVIISDIPGLNPNPGASYFSDRSGSLSQPSIIIWLPREKELICLLFSYRNEWGDLGLHFMENNTRDVLSIKLQSPVVREYSMYKICNNGHPTVDKPAFFKKGDRLTFDIKVIKTAADSIEEVFMKYPAFRLHEVKNSARRAPDLSKAFSIIEDKFNRRNWVDHPGYYSVGMRENFLQDWQIGWTGGMISTYPLYLIGGEQSRNRVMDHFEWFFNHGFSPSGLPWDSGEKGDQWYGGDIRRKQTANRHLVRKSADAIYYLSKQLFMLKEDHYIISTEWVRRIEGIAEIFSKNWDKYNQVGQFVDTPSGEIVIGGSTSGAILPAGLVLLFRLTGKNKWLILAEKIADYYYREYLSKGISCGGPGDALKNPDSESSYGLCESYILLYEETREKEYLEMAELAARFFSTWVMSYNYHFPETSLHGRLGVSTRGLVYANTQNKHLAPGICCYSGIALLNIYRYTCNPFYMDVLQDVVQAMPQYLSTPDRPVEGLEPGWISERVNATDWLEGIGETMQGSTWSETSLMLCAAELPSIFIDASNNRFWCLDQLICEMDDKQLIIKKLTDDIITIKILVEKELPGVSAYPNYGILFTHRIKLEANETYFSF